VAVHSPSTLLAPQEPIPPQHVPWCFLYGNIIFFQENDVLCEIFTKIDLKSKGENPFLASKNLKSEKNPEAVRLYNFGG
jgi:hypothetical protein